MAELDDNLQLLINGKQAIIDAVNDKNSSANVTISSNWTTIAQAIRDITTTLSGGTELQYYFTGANSNTSIVNIFFVSNQLQEDSRIAQYSRCIPNSLITSGAWDACSVNDEINVVYIHPSIYCTVNPTSTTVTMSEGSYEIYSAYNNNNIEYTLAIPYTGVDFGNGTKKTTTFKYSNRTLLVNVIFLLSNDAT